MAKIRKGFNVKALTDYTEKKKVGRPRIIESPEQLLELFKRYVTHTKNEPFNVVDWVGARAVEVIRQKEKPLTMEGLNVFCFELGYMVSMKDIFANSKDKFPNFSSICSHIREKIRLDQIAGGMSGIYNPSITQRLNNLTERTETTHIEQPFFPDTE